MHSIGLINLWLLRFRRRNSISSDKIPVWVCKVYLQKKEKFEFYKLFLSKYYGEYIETAYFNNISEVFFESLYNLLNCQLSFWLRNNPEADLTKVTSPSRHGSRKKTQIRERHDIRVRGKNIMSRGRCESGQLWADRKKHSAFTS